MELLSSAPPVSGLYHQPIELPRPYLYAAHILTGRFDPSTQHWLAVAPKELEDFFPGQPTGRLIPIQGTLQPGTNRLPIPFYTRLHGPIQQQKPGRIQPGP